jgi:glycosyltransferase involved in cell wall biosynthesis
VTSATPWLTVVVPVLNGAATITRALDSISSQQVPGVEIVVVDGASTDGTVQLLADRAGIRYVSEPDRGLSDAVNKGVAMAAGRMIGWLNADDTYLPGALQRVRAATDADPAAEWVTGPCVIVDGDGREIRPAVTRYKNALLKRYSHALHLTQNFVSAPSTFFTKEAYDAVGGMDVALRYAMDYDLFLRLGRRGRPVLLATPLATFSMTEGTLSMSGFERQFAEHADIARRYRSDAPVAVAVNAATSRGIVLAYRAMRAYRSR